MKSPLVTGAADVARAGSVRHEAGQAHRRAGLRQPSPDPGRAGDSPPARHRHRAQAPGIQEVEEGGRWHVSPTQDPRRRPHPRRPRRDGAALPPTRPPPSPKSPRSPRRSRSSAPGPNGRRRTATSRPSPSGSCTTRSSSSRRATGTPTSEGGPGDTRDRLPHRVDLEDVHGARADAAARRRQAPARRPDHEVDPGAEALEDRSARAPRSQRRQLLTHTAGIPREIDGTYWNDMNFPSREAAMPVLNRMGIMLRRKPSGSTRTSRSVSRATSSRRPPESRMPVHSPATSSRRSA